MIEASNGSKSEKLSVSAATSRLISLILKMPPDEVQTILERVQTKQIVKKRKAPRVEYFMEVDFVVNERYYSSYINDISINGVFIETHDSFEIEESITLSFALPNSQGHIKATGTIVRTSPDGIAVAFDVSIRTLMEQQKVDPDIFLK